MRSLTIDLYEKNLERVYNRASFEDQAMGASWYGDAKRELRKISKESLFPLKQVTWAAAVLSNNKGWEENISLVRNVAFQVKNGVKPSGHFDFLLEKAVKILRDNDLSALHGPKVVPFAHALWQPWSNACVVDRWMWRAANDGLELDEYSMHLTEARIRMVSAAILRIARANDIPATTVQATIWMTIRRESGR